MRAAFFLFFLSCLFALNAQDKIYLQNGNIKTGKVIEISPDMITFISNNTEQSIGKYDVLLIEFENGTYDLINPARETIIYNPQTEVNPSIIQKQKPAKVNYVSLNSLALYNADIAVFYEHTTKNKLFGFGAMGAYNFNLKTTLPNLFLSFLHNAKKNYDLGATLNFYPVQFSGETSIYFGVMIKYTSFSFDKVITDSTKNGNITSVNVSYTRTNGSQLATIFTVGTHTSLSDQFYLRTLAGFGAFQLNGDFRREFNSEINKHNNPNTQPVNYNFLPKMYLGINIGFNF